jgi:hypothetical protein
MKESQPRNHWNLKGSESTLEEEALRVAKTSGSEDMRL